MSTFITGDKHGNFHDVIMFALRNRTSRKDTLIILGDAGINYYADERDETLKKQLHQLQLTMLCVHGNHERRPETIGTYEEIERFGGMVYIEKEFPNLLFAKDGEIYDFGGRKCIVIGGALSIDKQYRKEGVDWWADEQPSDEIKKRVEQKLDSVDWRVDAVFSHTCPERFIPRECFLDFVDQKTVDQSTEKWLGEIEKRLDYKEWYCGHWHTDKRDGKMLFFFYQFRQIFSKPLN